MKFQRISAKDFNVKKSNRINVCNSLQHLPYNSLLDSNDFYDNFAKTYYNVVTPVTYGFSGMLIMLIMLIHNIEVLKIQSYDEKLFKIPDRRLREN